MPTTTFQPKSYLTDAERAEIRAEGASEDEVALEESEAADAAGDEESSWGWLARAELSAHTLAYYKNSYGAEFIRYYGFRTETADEVYGPGWLDRDQV
jgi:hypothetical protein